MATTENSVEHGTDYTEQLRHVFDMCDTEQRGDISVDHLVELARKYFPGDDWEESQEVGPCLPTVAYLLYNSPTIAYIIVPVIKTLAASLRVSPCFQKIYCNANITIYYLKIY